MNVDQLLDALAPYAVDLSYNIVANVWQVILYDWAFLHVEHADKTEALRIAYARVSAERAGER